jgi:hypothetical protein
VDISKSKLPTKVSVSLLEMLAKLVLNVVGSICLSPDTLADLSQFFSILNDLKYYRSAFSSYTNHL